MTKPEYMKVNIEFFPDDIIKQYNHQASSDSKGYIFTKIKKFTYGLKQAAVPVYQQLSARSNATGYIKIIGSKGMWKHNTRKTIFCFCVEDFGIRYFNKEDAQQLLNAL